MVIGQMINYVITLKLDAYLLTKIKVIKILDVKKKTIKCSKENIGVCICDHKKIF